MKTLLLTDGENVSPTTWVDYESSVWITLGLIGILVYFAIRVWWSIRKEKKSNSSK